MFENFTRYLLEKETYTEPELQQIAGVSSVVELAPGQLLFTEGSQWPYNGFICSGMLVNFTGDGAGGEKVLSFAPEMFWAGDRNSLLTGSAMPHTARALEPTFIVLIEHTEFERLRTVISRFNDMINDLIQRYTEVAMRNIMDNMIASDEEKYARLLAKIPTLPERAPRHLIASCLDITAEGLSVIIDGMPWQPNDL